MKDKQIKTLALGGVMAALVFVMTYFPRIPVLVTNGYIHLGDGMICLAAMLLGPVSIAAAAIGSALSDLVGGYMIYVLPTFLIKGLVALVVWKLYQEGNWLRVLLSFVAGELVMVLGYFVAETLLYGVSTAAAAIGPNLLQGLGGVVVGMICAPLVPRIRKAMK